MKKVFDSQIKRESEKFKRCPEPECGQMNDSAENFCVDCGAELPPAEDKSLDPDDDNVPLSDMEIGGG